MGGLRAEAPPVAPLAFRGPAAQRAEESPSRPRPRPAHRPLSPPDPETPLDCEVSLWSSWGLCAGPCGRPGAKSRTRYVRVRPANHGAPCPALEEEAPCDPDNCV